VFAGSQIIYAFIMMPHTLPQSYVRWIRKQGAKELYVWQGVRVRKDRMPRQPGAVSDGMHAAAVH
jgi:hypothetical protein